jgi:hypothetical protein
MIRRRGEQQWNAWHPRAPRLAGDTALSDLLKQVTTISSLDMGFGDLEIWWSRFRRKKPAPFFHERRPLVFLGTRQIRIERIAGTRLAGAYQFRRKRQPPFFRDPRKNRSFEISGGGSRSHWIGRASPRRSRAIADLFDISEAYATSAERKFLRWNCCLTAIHPSANNSGSRKLSFGSRVDCALARTF